MKAKIQVTGPKSQPQGLEAFSLHYGQNPSLREKISCGAQSSAMFSADASEIQEVNPPKTVAPPLQLQPLNEDLHVRWRIEAYINTISLIRAILEFHSQ